MCKGRRGGADVGAEKRSKGSGGGPRRGGFGGVEEVGVVAALAQLHQLRHIINFRRHINFFSAAEVQSTFQCSRGPINFSVQQRSRTRQRGRTPDGESICIHVYVYTYTYIHIRVLCSAHRLRHDPRASPCAPLHRSARRAAETARRGDGGGKKCVVSLKRCDFGRCRSREVEQVWLVCTAPPVKSAVYAV